MAKPVTTWIVVADGAQARFLETADDRRFALVGELVSPDSHEKAHALGRDRPGRSHESHDVTRHAIEPRVDPHGKAKQRFLDLVAEQIARAEASRRFDQLVLVAPRRQLGALRRQLAGLADDRIRLAVDKDLANLPAGPLAAQLVALLRSA